MVVLRRGRLNLPTILLTALILLVFWVCYYR